MLHSSPLLKSTCVRQVVSDKWFHPPNTADVVVRNPVLVEVALRDDVQDRHDQPAVVLSGQKIAHQKSTPQK